MKRFPLILASIAALALSACGNSESQSSLPSAATADASLAAIQHALVQANAARKAVAEADSHREMAEQRAETRMEAVESAVAQAAAQLARMKQIAQSLDYQAMAEQQSAIQAREVLLKAAAEKADAERILSEKIKAMEMAMARVESQEAAAKRAMKEKIAADKMLARITDAERLAGFSVESLPMVAQAAPATAAPQAEASPAAAAANSAVAKTTHAPVKVAKSMKAAKFAKAKAEAAPVATAAPAKQQSSVALAANAARGHELAQKCTYCHTMAKDEKPKSGGPNLFGVVGRQAGSADGYHYSKSLAAAEFTWDEKKLAEWICNSGKAIKNLTGNDTARTKMAALNMCGQDALDVASYIGTLKGSTMMTSMAD